MSGTAEWRDLGLRDVLKRLADLDAAEVRVGILGSGAQRLESSGLTVGEVAHINEYGSRKAGIPARPFVKPALTPTNLQPIARTAVAAVLDTHSAHDALTAAGHSMVSLVKAKLEEITTSGGNADSTVRKKGVDSPLHDTGKLAEAISYQITKGGSTLDAGFSGDDYESATY